MSLYDSVYIYCKKCNSQIEVQSMAGDCHLRSYSLDDSIPQNIVDSIINRTIYCEKCGNEHVIKETYEMKRILRY